MSFFTGNIKSIESSPIPHSTFFHHVIEFDGNLGLVNLQIQTDRIESDWSGARVNINILDKDVPEWKPQWKPSPVHSGALLEIHGMILKVERRLDQHGRKNILLLGSSGNPFSIHVICKDNDNAMYLHHHVEIVILNKQ